jgi:hypothetical protein
VFFWEPLINYESGTWRIETLRNQMKQFAQHSDIALQFIAISVPFSHHAPIHELINGSFCNSKKMGAL